MLKEFLKHNKIIILEIVVITFLVVINSLFFAGHYRTPFIDRGRELLIPLSILNGDVLYKSILTIYSPLSYLINAAGMYVLGKNISTLYILGTLNCCIFLSVFYFLCREFLNRLLSAVLVFVVLYGCICTDGITNYIFGHSFGTTYGLTAYLISAFSGLKYIKYGNINRLFLSSFFAGTAVCLKMDFFPIIFIIFFPVFYQKIGLKNILKMFGYLLTVPFSVFLFLFFQGLTFNELFNALGFMADFAKTDSMRNFYMEVGALPNFSLVKFFRYIFYGVEVFISCLLIYLGLFLSGKNKISVIVFGILSVLFFMFIAEPYYHFIFFPYVLLMVLIVKFPIILKDRELFFVILSVSGLLVRVWADLKMNFYGIYVLPWVYLTLSLLVLKFCSGLKIFSKVKAEHFLILFFAVHSVYYFEADILTKNINSYPVKTQRGTIYFPENIAENTNLLLNFIRNNTSEKDKILVLPEGQMINFLSERKSDMKIHMLDRLYYDALKSDKALKLLENSDYDYIITVNGFGLENFGKPYLFNENNSVTDYLTQNYELINIIGDKNNLIEIKKKINKNKDFKP